MDINTSTFLHYNPTTMDFYTLDEVLNMEDDAIAEIQTLLPNFAEQKLDDLTAAAISYAEANSLDFPEDHPPTPLLATDTEGIQAENARQRIAHINKWRHIFAYGIAAEVITIHVDDNDTFVIWFM